MLSTSHFHCECIACSSALCMAAMHCDFSMEREHIISNVADFGTDVLFLSSLVQMLGCVTSVWRGDSVDASHH